MRGETVQGSKPAVPGPMILRRGSALVTEQQARMALREQSVNDGTGVSPQQLQTEENTQEDAAVDDEDEFSLSLLPPASARDRRRRERGNKSNCKEMSEEEMMDLALRLSEREATVTASRLKQEEEAMMKAIKESMVNQTQTVLSSQSQSLLADVSSQLCSRRKLLYSNGKTTSASDQGDDCPTETGVKAIGDENNNRNKKRKREQRGSLPEMPDLMQTQDVYSQASPCSSESVSVPLDSPQSFDSTQRDDCPLHKSPIFPLTGCRATVCMSRLSQDLLETCKVSGFVLCSQDSWIQKSLEVKSPTFPKSPMNFPAGPNSPVFTDINRGDDGEQRSPERGESPVFGITTLQDQSPSACKPQVCRNSGFAFSSQESFSSTGRSASCRSDSPVFPGNLPAVETSAIFKNPVFSGTEAGRAEQSHGCSTSPVYGCTVRRQTVDSYVMNSSVVRSSAELGGSNGAEPSQSLEVETCKTDPSWDGGFKKLGQSATADAQDSEASKGCGSAEEELTSDMTLLWSDEDDGDVTPAGSPSPVFPEERPVHRAAADPETTGSNCSWTSSWGTNKRASGPCEEPAAVHYYWGVPFCPRGLDPDKYTQVILAQMEVYEKSLKQAQRCLLRKAEWGEPVLPGPENRRSPESPAESPRPQIPQRHCLRLRRKKQHESADTSAEEEEEKETDSENKEDEKNDEDDTDDCAVCPETQLSDVNNDQQDLPVVPDDAQARPGSAELPDAQRILPGDSPAAGLQEEEMEVDGTAARLANAAEWSGNVFSTTDPRETDGSWNAAHLKGDRLDPDVEEGTEQKLQRSGSPEVEAAAAPGSPAAHMDCPICQGSFPVTEIEVHAAYCDGEVAVVDERRPDVPSLPNALKPRRKRTRRAEAMNEDVDGRNQEKCYICQRAVPLRDYSRHTELCIQQQAAKPEARGSLLSALERSEGGDSGAGPSRLQPGDVIDLRDDGDGLSAFRISDSPIRSFTPISEATDCLIDFRKPERSKKPSRRRK